jgi:hypothetical protein
MCWLIRTPRSQYTPSRTSWIFLCLCSIAALTCSACGTIPREDDSGQYIRIENQNLFRIRAYAAFSTSSSVRILLGTVEPNEHEEFRVPSALRGTRALVVRCEKGRPAGFTRSNEYFETAFVSIPLASTLLVTVRNPMRYSDFSVLSME